MHRAVEGMPALAALSTLVWQYLQSMPSSTTWWRWSNCTGCTGGSSWPVPEGVRAHTIIPPRVPMAPPTTRKMTSLKMVSLLGLNSELIHGELGPPTPADGARRPPGLVPDKLSDGAARRSSLLGRAPAFLDDLLRSS